MTKGTLHTVAVLLAVGGMILAMNSARADSILWYDASLTYLNGSDYELGDPNRQVITGELAGATRFGRGFFFFDHLRSSNGENETYAELSPDFYLSTYDQGVIRSTVVATTLERGENFTNYLVGLGVGLALPGFNYFNLNFYRRLNEGLPNNYQTTLTWAVPFSIGSSQWLVDGFIDWASGTQGLGPANLNATSQLKWNIAPYFNRQSAVYVGIEHVYWRNKFYVAGVTENNINVLFKWHF